VFPSPVFLKDAFVRKCHVPGTRTGYQLLLTAIQLLLQDISPDTENRGTPKSKFLTFFFFLGSQKE
jgi:hypothetical protein